MVALLAKETRELVPYWLAVVGLLVAATLALLLDSDLVLLPLATRYDHGDESVFQLMLLGILLGHGAVAREVVNGHMEFLDALPTTRVRVYLAKALAVLAPCVFLIVGSAVMDLALQQLAPVPHQRSGARAVWVLHGVQMATLVFAVGLGMLLSWLRGLAFGVIVVGLVSVLTLTVLVPSVGDVFPVPSSAYGKLVWERGVPWHPLGPPLLWAGVGVAAMAVSGALFVGPGEALLRRGSGVVAVVRVGGLGCGGLLLSGLAGIALVSVGLQSTLTGIRVDTSHEPFRVLYRGVDEAEVRTVTEDLRALARQVAAAVGWDGELPPLDIEFLGAAPNHAGVFTGGKIRLGKPDRAVLAHELAHAMAFQLTGPAAWHQGDHTRFFSEGLASWVAAEVSGEPSIPLEAAAIHATGQARFELLVEDDLLIEQQDIVQAYPLGHAFVSTLVAEAGAEAVACVLREQRRIGRRTVAGLALWYGMANACDFDLDTVIARWEADLEERAEELPILPRVHARQRYTERGLVLEVVDERYAGLQLLCRFRSDAEAPVEQYRQTNVSNGACLVPTAQLAGATFDYQLGFRVPVRHQPASVFLPWVRDVPSSVRAR
ncbi:MAG: ABC transporter permease [Myxococcales bacterium]|nr:ABC transporter permease [Myxococcales bacterium]